MTITITNLIIYLTITPLLNITSITSLDYINFKFINYNNYDKSISIPEYFKQLCIHNMCEINCLSEIYATENHIYSGEISINDINKGYINSRNYKCMLLFPYKVNIIYYKSPNDFKIDITCPIHYNLWKKYLFDCEMGP